MDSEQRGPWHLPGGLRRFGIGWHLVGLMRVVWWSVQSLDGAIENVLKRLLGTRYERTGGCARTGECCEFIALSAPGFAHRAPWLLGVFVRLGEILYPFRLHGRSGDD